MLVFFFSLSFALHDTLFSASKYVFFKCSWILVGAICMSDYSQSKRCAGTLHGEHCMSEIVQSQLCTPEKAADPRLEALPHSLRRGCRDGAVTRPCGRTDGAGLAGAGQLAG